jgi:hypothetical protein
MERIRALGYDVTSCLIDLGFNTNPADSADAVRRWIAP